MTCVVAFWNCCVFAGVEEQKVIYKHNTDQCPTTENINYCNSLVLFDWLNIIIDHFFDI